ncbi:MAG: hypothetical protein ACREE6_06705 [Limisphaerales bacterium]
MNPLSKMRRFIHPGTVYIEIGMDSFRALQENEGFELPIERQNNGRLTEACRENLASRLKTFVKRQKWQLRAKAHCAIGGSGVSLRRVALPPAAKNDWQRLLLLQIETEFPIGPEELAWGYLSVSAPSVDGMGARREFVVAATRKEALEDYSALLSGCGLSPVFTLAALARSRFCPQTTGRCAILDLDRKHSEWIGLENNVPAALRIFPWGTDDLTAPEAALDGFAQAVRNQGKYGTLFVTGAGGQWHVAASLAAKLADAGECRWVDAEGGAGRSAAVLGLRQWTDPDGSAPPLVLRMKPRPVTGLAGGLDKFGKLRKFEWADPALRDRAILAAILVLALIALPYAQAFLLKPYVARKVAAIQSQQGRLDTIDRELSFLQYLKQNSPPYLNALYLFAQAAPPGTSFNSVTMNERGEVSLGGTFGGFQQIAEFRAKLIQSGFFSNVSVEEQAPAPFPHQVNVRMTALWKSAADRARLTIGPTADEIAAVGKESASSANGPGGMGPHPRRAGRANTSKSSKP